MATTAALTGTPRTAEQWTRRRSRRWSLAHWLAVIAVPILIHEVWSVTAWLLDGPFQVTEYRDRNHPTWYAAHAIEAAAVLVSIIVLIYVVRGCRREQTLFTFDAMFCMAGATLFYVDGSINVLGPTFLQSSQFVNLNNICGYMPFVVNPDCSRLPDAILLYFLLETFGFLGIAIVVQKIVSRLKRPHWSKLQLFGFVMAIGILLDLLIEVGYMIPLQLYSYGNLRGPVTTIAGVMYPWWVLIPNGIFFGAYVCIRNFKDDRSLTLVERGLERYSPRKRIGLTLLALYGAFQLVFWGLSIPWWIANFYQGRWPANMPAHVVNDVCNAGGFTDTRYGPCPGSEGFRLPLRSLPGEKLGHDR